MSKENVFVIDDPSLIGWVEDGVTSDGDPVWKWDQEGASDSTGAGMIICSETELPPVNERVTGMQWLDSESSNVYVWDDDKWLMFPATGGQGADGAPGEVEEAPDDGKQYVRESKDWSEIVIPDGGTGSSVHIGEAPPADPQEGQQWMEVPANGDATMWIYDGDKWLQQPGGKDGADGADGMWTDNGDGSISYQNVTIADYGMSLTGNQYITATNPDDSSGFTQYSNTSGSMSVGMAGETANKLLIYDRKEGNVAATYEGGASGGWDFWTNNQDRMTIDADGEVTVANNQIALGVRNSNEPTIGFRQSGGDEKLAIYMEPNNFGLYFWDPVLSQQRMQLDKSGNLFVFGNIYKNNSTPVMATSDMVKAFSKLRDAVKDEETVESLKESITNCIGGLIEEWEAMQSTATQEISDE